MEYVYWIFGSLFCCSLVVGHRRSQECSSNAVGLRYYNGIPYYYFQATSYSKECFRKNLNKYGDGATWCPLPSKAKQSYIEVDLGCKYSLCGFSTHGDTNGFTKQYKLEISLDRIKWRFYQDNGVDKIFSGNFDSSTDVMHNFTSIQEVRFIRFYPIQYEINACMNVELYGEKIPIETCNETIFGTSTHMYNINITASSNLSSGENLGILNGTQSWCPHTNDTDLYLQIDFGSYIVLCAMETQDNNLKNPKISFQFEFLSKNKWTTYKENMENKIFNSSEVYILHERVLGRYIRFKPFGDKGCLTLKIYGYSYEVLLNADIGLKYEKNINSKHFPDESFATTRAQFDKYYPPWSARLYSPMSAWCPNDPGKPSYIELILVEKYYIFAVTVQGYWDTYNDSYFPMKYNISYSDNYHNWSKYPTLQQINFPSNDVVYKHVLEHPIEGRVFRIEFLPSSSIFCLRVELHGISMGKSEFCEKQYPLGLSDYNGNAIIKDDSIHVSSVKGFRYKERYARLHDERCWCAKGQPEQYIKIDLKQMVTVSGLAVQACSSGYVTEYEISYSYDGVAWYDYIYQNNITETFRRNSSSDGEDVSAIWLKTPLITRHIKITILNYETFPCLRLELYGCREDDGSPIIEKYDETATLNRSKGHEITLNCVMRGQPGMIVTWTRNDKSVENSLFEKYNTVLPLHNTISSVVESELTITYNSDPEIYNSSICIESIRNPRIMFCSSVYTCSARYPNTKSMAQQEVTVTITPSIILADVPGRPLVYNVKSRSADVSWKPPSDYRESRITEYVVLLLNGSILIKRRTILSDPGLINGILSTSFSDLSEFTMYSVKTASVNAISMSSFTNVNFYTLLTAMVSVNQPNIMKVIENEKNLSITCTGRSYPKPYVRWRKNGKELTIINITAPRDAATIYQFLVESKKSNKTSTKIEVNSTLFLRPAGIKYEDYGNYSCEVLNANESNIPVQKTIEILFPATIVTISQTEFHKPMDNVTLYCNASGHPFPRVTWTKFNKSVSLKEPTFVFSNNNQTLTIRNISLWERETYTCTVHNIFAVDTKNVTVYVEVRSKASVNISLVLLQTINEMAVIKCIGTGFPAPIVRWFRKGKLINIQNNNNLDVYQRISTKSVEFLGEIVSILYVNPDETYQQFGNYTCNATKTKDNDQDLTNVEIVLVPTVNITRHPDKETVLEGTDVQFNCKANGSPKPLVKWSRYRSDRVFKNATALGSNLLVLRNITNNDEGKYICSAKNRGKHVMVNVTVTVHVKPRILTKLIDADVQNDTLYQLNCSAYGDPDVKYTWRKDMNQTTPNSQLINQNKALKINPVTIENEGLYTCIVTNIEGNASTTAKITVFARPEILNPPKSQALNKTQTATLYCIGKGIPTPEVIWRKNGEVIRNYTRYNIMTTGSMEDKKSTLTIQNLQYDDRGNYSCTMKNRKDFRNKTAVLTVQVRPSASVVKSLYRIKVSKPVNLTCVVYGFPRPNVLWTKSGEKINQSPKYRIVWNKTESELKWHSILEINTLQRNDNGSFICFLENAAGTDQTSLSLVVLERPDRLHFSSSNITSQTVIMEWKVTFDGNSDIKYFVLNYSSNVSKNGLQNENFTLPPNETMLMVQNLKPWTWYTFRVTAINDIGSGEASFLTRRTSENLPSSPENVSVVTLSATALTVTWSPPKEENGIITKYVIYYGEKGQTNIINASASLLRRDVGGLKPNTKYTIQIEAYTSIGAGERSNSFVGLTYESVPSEPRNVGTEVINRTSMRLVWSSPERENGIILWYIVHFKEDGRNKTTIYFIVPGTSNEKLITKLNPFTTYNFWVQARNSAGNGNISEVVRNQTVTGAPARVISIDGGGVYLLKNNVTLTVILTCSVEGKPNATITWKKVDNQNHPISVYSNFILQNNNRTMIIKNVTFNDTGIYVCIAENKYAKDRKNTSVTIGVKPFVNFLQPALSVVAETPVTISCVFYGFPKPDVIWIKNAHEMHASDHYYFLENPTWMSYTFQSELHIPSTWKNDTGNYSCFVRNVAGTNISRTSLDVFAFPDLKATSSLEHVEMGQNFTITCSTKNEINFARIDTLDWIKDGMRIDPSSSGQYKIISFEKLLVVNSSVWQSGRYQCNGTIEVISKLSSFVDVIVFVPSGPISFESKLETSATGIKLSWEPISNFYWNGQQVTYKISVMEKHREVKVVYTLQSNIIIAGLQPNTTYKIILSGNTDLGEIPPAQKEATTKPNKNSKQYELDVKLTDMEFSVNLEDPLSGEYRELKTSLEKSIDNIYKESSLRFQFIKSRITGFRRGSIIAEVTTSFDSTFSQNPSVIVQRLNEVKTIGGHKFDKLFTAVKDFDECENEMFNSCHEYANCSNIFGSYICKCFEGFFGDGEKCQGPAQIIAKSSSKVIRLVETNVTLICTVIGDPNPVITWLRRYENGDVVQMKSTTDKSDGNLTIFDATIEDSGVYVCNASNSLGHQSYETRLTIKPVIVNIEIEIKLNKTFNKELKNKSSSEYKKLERNVYVELYNFFNNTPGFDDIEILGFANGSVITIFKIILKVLKPSTNTKDMIITLVGKKLIYQLKKGRIGNILVVPDAFKIQAAPLPPVNLTYSDVKETEMHIYWDPPELHEVFSIHTYYIRYRKFGEKNSSNDNQSADISTNTPLRNLKSNSFYSVHIVAENAYGCSKNSPKIDVKTMEKKVISPWYYIVPIISILVVALMVIVFFVCRRFCLTGNWNIDSKKEGQFKKESVPSFQLVDTNERNDHENEGFIQTDANTFWDEIPRSSIELDRKLLVPPGEFGVIVVEGKVLRPLLDISEPCSVKMFKDYTTGQSNRDLMEELHNISAVGTHTNIVNLIGACTDSDESPLLVLELCCNGTLENYLKTNKKIDDAEGGLQTTLKIRWTNEIAQGMNHLAASMIVHRDLSARNVLLTEDLTAKIYNFGLSRNICERGSYENLSGGKLPARWMAIESLQDGSYSLKSDVWSFGILLWEIETGASVPYQDFEVTEMIEQLLLGYRLPKPDECQDKSYNLMLQCWKINPFDRPSFDEICDIFENSIVGDEKTFVNVPLAN